MINRLWKFPLKLSLVQNFLNTPACVPKRFSAQVRQEKGKRLLQETQIVNILVKNVLDCDLVIGVVGLTRLVYH
jgi:hypothetical protein